MLSSEPRSTLFPYTTLFRSVDPEELEDMKGASPVKVLREINRIVDVHLQEFSRIFHGEILAGLYQEGLMLYQGDVPPDGDHQRFIRDYFYREVIPYLQPVLLTKGTRSFLRDNRLYLAIKLFRKKGKEEKEDKKRRARYAIVKLPTNDLPRFIRLPDKNRRFYYVFLDYLVRFNLQELFPGYDIESSRSEERRVGKEWR